ncbi:hypothetical protein BMW22_32010 (plasmid) [Rhizobium leguminosarum]|uniref:Uncharacterized protein n=1 Tax=Rhizobium leguminosarum TaxID=384 RepID=A0A1L3ZKI4_RHILE|nr:hypothetical protein BMW22_32010 [Rhizobium leguminosarum]
MIDIKKHRDRRDEVEQACTPPTCIGAGFAEATAPTGLGHAIIGNISTRRLLPKGRWRHTPIPLPVMRRNTHDPIFKRKE